MSVFNAAARLTVNRRKCDHITNSLRDELNLLTVQYMFIYKQCNLVYYSLHSFVTSHLAERCVPIAMNATRSSLRSSTDRNLAYPRTILVRHVDMLNAPSACWSKDMESAADRHMRSRYQFGYILQETKYRVNQ